MANQNLNLNQKQFSDELNQEVSSIKPDLGTGQKEKQIPRFTYSTAEYQSYSSGLFVLYHDSILSYFLQVQKSVREISH